MPLAYLILFIDTEHRQEGHFVLPAVVAAGIFGSPHVTSDLKRRYPVVLFSAEGETYEGAAASIKKSLEAPWLSWVAKLLAIP